MNTKKTKQSKKSFMPPGTVVHLGEQKMSKVKITLIDYDQDNFNEVQVENIEDCFKYKKTKTVTWINIDGLHDVEMIDKIGKNFDIHPLVLEDIVNTRQRPKFEEMDKYIYVVLRMLSLAPDNSMFSSEQVSMILADNYIITFQEQVGDVFEQIRDRIRKDKGRIRKMGCDYLVYALMDSIVDNYFLILESFGETIESIEEELIADPDKKILSKIHTIKRELILLRKSVWPLRELINAFERSESDLIDDTITVFLRDVYDHTIQIIDTVESYRDMVSGMIDLYLSSLSNKMNEVMKVLTIIATLFIPLTFVAGIYGMNFENMPELKWKFGYLGVWMIMTAVTLVMLFYFKRKKWL